MASQAPVALLTGASRGIGAHAAACLAAKGVRLAAGASNADALRESARNWSEAGPGPGGQPPHAPLLLTGDLAQADIASRWVEETLEHFGQIDMLVNNAGIIGPIGAVGSYSPEEVERNLAINLLAPMRLVRHALGPLSERGGRIVNVSSGAGLRPVPGWGAYCTAKAGLNNFNSVIAAEYPGVTAIAFSPGMTDTGMQADIRRDGPGGMPGETLSVFVDAHESGALRSAESVGKALAALTLLADRSYSGQFVDISEERVAELVKQFDAASD